jgi:hypothetical protein
MRLGKPGRDRRIVLETWSGQNGVQWPHFVARMGSLVCEKDRECRLSPRVNYTDWATAAFSKVSANFWGWRMPRGRRDGSLWLYSRLSSQEPLLFLWSSSSIVLTRLSESRSRLLIKSGRAENRTQNLWICSQELWPLDHRGGPNICGY